MGTSFKTGNCPSIITIHEKVTESRKGVKPGDIVKKGNLLLRVVEGRGCKKCFFWRDNCCQRSGSEKSWGSCSAYNRPDQTWIIFQKVEDNEQK